jgi:DNA-binding response OmpR family regulator
MSARFVSRRILLVEDDDELRYAYATHLTANGFVVEEAGDLFSLNSRNLNPPSRSSS